MNAGQSEMSTTMKFFLLATVCIIVNIILYLFEDKWIGGVFSGAWLLATLLIFGYNNWFNLNVTDYSITTLLRKYFLPILTYLAWIGVIYWWITAQNDLSENPDHSQVSRNFAAVMTFFIPVLAGIVTFFSKKYAGEGVGWAIVISLGLLFLGSYSYYINTLREGCDKNISKNICWTYSGNVAFLCFIIMTVVFLLISPLDFGPAKFLQFLPKIILTNPTVPLSIFSIIAYLMLWISLIIVLFRHNSKFFDDESDPVNETFTVIGILMFLLLLFKDTFIVKGIIHMVMYIKKQPWSAILLHATIITTFIASIYSTSMYLESEAYNSNLLGIQILTTVLSAIFLVYLVSIFKAFREYYISIS
jgi:hypothetical protein